MEEKGKGTLVNRRTNVIVCTGVIVAAFLALAGSASAAYAPKIEVELNPAKQRSDVAITTTITQKSDETANKTVLLNFPKDWSIANSKLTGCTDAQSDASACPETSRMGTAEARVPIVGSLSGNVYLGATLPGGKLKIWVFIANAIIKQRIMGTVGLGEGGRLFSMFDNLPDTLTTFFQLKLDGPPRSLAQTSFGCDDAVFDAQFTSQKGEKATGKDTVPITGCPDRPPVVSSIDVGPSPAPPAKGGTMTYELDQAAAVVVTVVKQGTTKVLQTFKASGKEGSNKIRGLGKGLKKSKYQAIVKATDTGGQVRTKKFSFRVG
jgi:hypothetical protein